MGVARVTPDTTQGSMWQLPEGQERPRGPTNGAIISQLPEKSTRDDARQRAYHEMPDSYQLKEKIANNMKLC